VRSTICRRNARFFSTVAHHVKSKTVKKPAPITMGLLCHRGSKE
jgi:hypothetical protein